MLLGIDHVILAVPDLERAAAEMSGGLGLSVGGGGRHDAHGTHNRLAWLGDSYLELMAVFDPALAAQSWWGQRALAAVASGGGLMGLALASDDVAADAARLSGAGSPILPPSGGERRRADGDVVRWQIARLPADDPALGLLFLIEHDADAAEWRPADRSARATETHPLATTARLLRLEVAVSDVRRTSQRLLRDLGLQFRPSLMGEGARDTSIGNQLLRLSHLGADAVAPAIGLRAGTQSREVDLLGLRWEFVPA